MASNYGKHTPESVARQNANVVNQFSAQFAAIVNAHIEFNSKAKAIKAMAIFDSTAQYIMQVAIKVLQKQYASNWYHQGVFTATGVTAGANSQPSKSLTQNWAMRKFKAAVKTPKTATEKTTTERNNFTNTALQHTYWHGLGYLNAQPKSDKRDPLRSWVSKLNDGLLGDNLRLYRMLGESDFQMTGNLLKKGFVRKDGRVFKVIPVRGKQPKLQRSTLKEAINWHKLHTSSALKGKGFVTAKQVNGNTRYSLSGKQVSIFKLNQLGLAGSKLKLTAFNNFYTSSATNNSKFAQLKTTHSQQHFFIKAMRSGKDNIFSDAALYKLGFSARPKYNRTPVTDLLSYLIGTELPKEFSKRMLAATPKAKPKAPKK